MCLRLLYLGQGRRIITRSVIKVGQLKGDARYLLGELVLLRHSQCLLQGV